MGIMDFIKNELLEVIEWVDNTNDTIIWKFPDNGNKIMNGAKLTVRESQRVVLMNEGDFGDEYAPGLHKLTTSNMPVLTTLSSWKYGFESPFKVDVYFVSTKQFTNVKWGTSGPVIVRDAEFGQVRLKSFGNFSFRIQDIKKFITEFAGTKSIVRVDDVERQLKGVIANRIAEGLAEANVSILDLAKNYSELGDKIIPVFQKEFDAWGIKIEKFFVENVSLPEEVEKMLDKKTELNILKDDIGDFQKMQAGIALEKISDNPGTGDVAGIGVGVLLNNIMNQNMQPAQKDAAIQQASKQELLDVLKQLGDLKASGVISEEEFNSKKQDILARL